MSKDFAFECRAFGCSIRFEAECAELYASIDRYVLPGISRSSSGSDRADVILRLARVSGRVQLICGDAVVTSADSALALVPNLVNLLDDALLPRLRNLYAVHAGAVLLGDRAVIFPGATHCGKSSLVAELLRQGAKCFSDEYALIDPQGRIHPYPRPLLLRNAQGQQSPALPEECGSSFAESPAPIDWILSLEYQPAQAWDVAVVPQSMAMLSLLKNTPHALADAPGMVDAFQHAVAPACCYAGHRAEAADAVRHIVELVRDCR